MKKQIISLLILISLSCQSTYPALDTAAPKKSDTIPWWRIRALYKALREAEKELHSCGRQQCKQEKIEADEATAEWSKIPFKEKLAKSSSRLFLTREQLGIKQDAYWACLGQRCKQKYTTFHMLWDRFDTVATMVGLAVLVSPYIIVGIGSIVAPILDFYLYPEKY